MRKILLAIDDDLLRLLYRRALEEEGFKVFGVQTEKEIFEVVDKESPDLILIDIALEGVKGIEILRKIKEEKKLTTPILLFSVIREESYLKEAQKLGVKEFILSFETSPRQLAFKIKSILQ